MTSTEKLKFIIEQTEGMCWHDPVKDNMCSCGHSYFVSHTDHKNPLPDDLNVLIELAKKHNCHSIVFFRVLDETHEFCEIDADYGRITGAAKTPAKALLNALYKAIRGE